jgi:hypothetical protein
MRMWPPPPQRDQPLTIAISLRGHLWLASQQLEDLGTRAGTLDLPARFHPQFRDKNRRDIGKSQSKWTASKMETPRSPGW